MRLVLLGLPGAGKGTQGEKIAEKHGIPHISTGSMIRAAIASGSSHGQLAQGFIQKGELVPDELAIEIVRERLAMPDCFKGWILDGFPRTVQQAIHLDQALGKDKVRVEFAFDIRISQEEAIRRISMRRLCRDCGATYHLGYHENVEQGICKACNGELYQRSDDNEETARNRLKVYMDQTHPVLHYYATDGRLYSVDGERRIRVVFQDVDAILEGSTEKQAGFGDTR